LRYFLLIICLYISTIGAVSQNKVDIFFNEFCASINRSNVKDYNTKDKLGFGLGIYHAFLNDKMINILVGLELNRLCQFKISMYGGHFSHRSNVTYNTNYLSFPLGLRLNFGKKNKLFIESGGFADFTLSGNSTGTLYTYYPDENIQISEFENKGGLPSSFGISFGLGIIIPISKLSLIIKGDYNIGLNDLKYSGAYEEFQNKYIRILIGFKIN
jgi:hypothetical protein